MAFTGHPQSPDPPDRRSGGSVIWKTRCGCCGRYVSPPSSTSRSRSTAPRRFAGWAPLLREIPSARLFDEVLKLFLAGRAERTFELLVEYELFAPLFPASAKALQANPDYTGKLIRQAPGQYRCANSPGQAGNPGLPLRRTGSGRPCRHASRSCRRKACRPSRRCRKPPTN
ncbi:hypothetical protein [Pseudomonas aeruginosa]|uniref:hypothetical protein n=1 Tax=Pseudomonas aeruginosa TaxID=287 RepID=UPI003D2B026D